MVVSKYQVETEYAYRASQTAPLFDADASDTPDHWSSSALTWTDAAPRVWRIERTRPSSGGTWSAWGGSGEIQRTACCIRDLLPAC